MLSLLSAELAPWTRASMTLLCTVQAVCVEAGMLALRRDATEVNHEDMNEGIIAVQAKKKANLNYYA